MKKICQIQKDRKIKEKAKISNQKVKVLLTLFSPGVIMN